MPCVFQTACIFLCASVGDKFAYGICIYSLQYFEPRTSRLALVICWGVTGRPQEPGANITVLDWSEILLLIGEMSGNSIKKMECSRCFWIVWNGSWCFPDPCPLLFPEGTLYKCTGYLCIPCKQVSLCNRNAVRMCPVIRMWARGRLLNGMFSNTRSLGSSLNVRDQVSHPYGTRGKIIVL
jgi:hypothetical protein